MTTNLIINSELLQYKLYMVSFIIKYIQLFNHHKFININNIKSLI